MLTGFKINTKTRDNQWRERHAEVLDEFREANVMIASSFLQGRQPGKYPLFSLLEAQAKADEAEAKLDYLLADRPDLAVRVSESLGQMASQEVADNSQRFLSFNPIQKLGSLVSRISISS